VKADIYQCYIEAMPKPVDCYNCDSMNTFKTIVLHWLVFIEDDLASCKDHLQPFFLTPCYRTIKMTMFGL
jgi:hypothetical protein